LGPIPNPQSPIPNPHIISKAVWYLKVKYSIKSIFI
jgi:hypothetical protein